MINKDAYPKNQEEIDAKLGACSIVDDCKAKADVVVEYAEDGVGRTDRYCKPHEPIFLAKAEALELRFSVVCVRKDAERHLEFAQMFLR